MGIQAFEDSVDHLNKEWKQSHRPFEMTVKLIDDKNSILSSIISISTFRTKIYLYMERGHYEIECVGNDAIFPRIQKCNLTFAEMIEVGEFIDMFEMNNTLYLDYIVKSSQIIKR